MFISVRKLLAFLAFSTLAFGQGSQLPKYTVATLPAASTLPAYTVQVIDGTTAVDCTVGGATGTAKHNVLCTASWNGSAYVWVPVSTGGAGGPLAIQHNGTNVPTQNILNFLDSAPSLPSGYTSCTFTNDGEGGLGCYVPPFNVSTSFETQITAPAAGQYVFVPFTNFTITQQSGPITASNTSTSMFLGGGGPFEIDDTVVFSNAVLPSYIVPGNVTAIYAVAVSSQSNYFLYNNILLGPGAGLIATINCSSISGSLTGLGINGWVNQQVTQTTSLTGSTIGTSTCTAHLGANYSGGGQMILSRIGFLVYYTGTAPPADTNVLVQAPLSYNPDSKTLALSYPPDVALDSGSVNAYAISLPWANFGPGLTVRMLVSHQSTSATPTLVLNGNAPRVIVGPTGLPLAGGDLKTTFPAILTWNATNWVLQNPQSSQPTSGSGPSQTAVTSAATIAPTTRFFLLSGSATVTTITAPAFCTVTGTMCQITMIPATGSTWTTATGGNIALGSTAVPFKALVMTYDPGSTLWYPSY